MKNKFALLMFTAVTVLYFAQGAQAQMQSLTYPEPAPDAGTEAKQEKPKLYVEQPPPAATQGAGAAGQPDGLAPAADFDDQSKMEMDRVYQMYKELSEKQRAQAADKPAKTQTTPPASNAAAAAGTGGHARSRSLTADTAPPRQTQGTQPTSPQGGAAGVGIGDILKSYQGSKGGAKTRSLQITDPEKFDTTQTPAPQAQKTNP